jgi:hypothetical protein
MPTSRKCEYPLSLSTRVVNKFISRHPVIIICLVALAALAGAVITMASGAVSGASGEIPSRTATAAESSQLRRAAPIRAAGRGNPWINFQDGRELRARYAGPASAEAERLLKPGEAQALSLASDDVDLDGFPDLVCGYAGASGGAVTLHLGNPEAFAPKKEATIKGIVNGRYPDPFLPEAAVLLTPEAPDYLAVGDFNRDGYPDIIAAARGGSSIHLLAGDENHAFHSAQSTLLPGRITTMIVGEINYPDGLKDVAVGVEGGQGPAVLVFDGAAGALSGKPVSYPLRAVATAMAVGRLDDDSAVDLAVVAGGEIVIIHGRERRPSGRYEDGFEEVFGRMEPVRLPFAVKTVAVSDFIWDRDSRMEMAALSEDGAVQILKRGELDSRPLTESEAREGRRLAAEAKERGLSAPAIRRAAKPLKWEVAERTSVVVSKAGDHTQPLLMGTLASGQRSYDLLVMNPAARRLHIAMREDGRASAKAVSIDVDEEPLAALPMRLNVNGRPGVVVLRRGRVEPAFIMAAAMATFVVGSAADQDDVVPGDGVCDSDPGAPVVCTLRAALQESNALTGADMITFAPALNGAPLQLTQSGDDNNADNGDLDINTDITILGNGLTNTIVQGSSDAGFTSNMGDKIFGVNQDGTNPTLNASFTGLTVRFTRNDLAVNPNFTQTGGAMDIFLTGTGATPGPTTTVANCVFDGNASLHSYGGAVNVDSGSLTPPATGVFRGTVQFTNVTISNNDTLTLSAADNAPTGGGVNLFGDIHNVTFTNCTITGNQTSAINTANGGGINIRHSNGGLVTLAGTTVMNNTAGSDGGGVALTFNQNFTMTGGGLTGNTAQGTGGDADGGGLFNGTGSLPSGALTLSLSGVTISGNTATAGANARGGGLHNNANSPITLTNCVITDNSSDTGAGVANVAGAVTINGTTPTNSLIAGNTAGASGGGAATLAASAVTNITNTMISGNSGPASGGALFVSGGTLTASLNRIVSNPSSPSGSGIAQTGGTANVENNWWGCDGFPNATGCQTGVGTFDADPRIDLKVTASPTSVSVGGTSTITASFGANSNNVAINPIVMNGLPVAFSATNGAMSPATGTTANLAATSVLSNMVCANGAASATVDNGTDSAAITFVKANTTTTITGDAPDPSVVGQQYIVAFAVTDSTGGAPTGNVTVSDGVNSCVGTVASGQCALTSTTLGPKTLVATYAGDACFNGSSDTEAHTVNAASTTTTVTSSQNPSVFGQPVTFTATVSASPNPAVPTGSVVFTIDGSPSALITLNASGQATLTTSSLSVGSHAVTAAYTSNSPNFSNSSGSLTQTVNSQTPPGNMVIIDFNGAPPGDYNPYSEDGFTLTPSGGATAVRISDFFSPGDNAAGPDTGFGQGLDSSFTFTNDSNLPFDAVSIDLLEAVSAPQAFGVTIIGTKADQSMVTQTFTLDGIAGKQNFTFSPDFTELVSLKIAEDSSNAFFTDDVQIDNVVLALSSRFNFSGFFPPVNNAPRVNVVNAGRAIPVKFSLGGDQGLGIFAPGSPVSQQITCSEGAPSSEVEETVTAGGSSLSYDAETDTYTYVWKTQKAWAGTCRKLIVRLNDGSEHVAFFNFR